MPASSGPRGPEAVLGHSPSAWFEAAQPQPAPTSWSDNETQIRSDSSVLLQAAERIAIRQLHQFIPHRL